MRSRQSIQSLHEASPERSRSSASALSRDKRSDAVAWQLLQTAW